MQRWMSVVWVSRIRKEQAKAQFRLRRCRSMTRRISKARSKSLLRISSSVGSRTKACFLRFCEPILKSWRRMCRREICLGAFWWSTNRKLKWSSHRRSRFRVGCLGVISFEVTVRLSGSSESSVFCLRFLVPSIVRGVLGGTICDVSDSRSCCLSTPSLSSRLPNRSVSSVWIWLVRSAERFWEWNRPKVNYKNHHFLNPILDVLFGFDCLSNLQLYSSLCLTSLVRLGSHRLKSFGGDWDECVLSLPTFLRSGLKWLSSGRYGLRYEVS